MKKKLSVVSRILLLLAAGGLIVVLFTAIWHIDLDAPQYPEGLSLKIYANGLKGNVDIINGLNHYIGMKTLHNEDFIEFKILPYAILFFVVLFLVTALVNRKKWLNISFALFVLFGVIAMYDFWKWEYDYGHNLNPDAAIKVPGMAYQPPLIGFKQLLNFGAYSVPDTGGWIFIGAGVLLLLAVIVEWKRKDAVVVSRKIASLAVILFCSILVESCNAGPQPIAAGTDNCYFCKMTITDSRFGAEIVTSKGKVFKFDDMHCLLSFINSKMIDSKEIKDVYVADFTGPHTLINVKQAHLLKGSGIHGPMNGDIIAIEKADSTSALAEKLSAAEVNWEQLVK